jgi:hypothetical protein
MMAIRKKNAVKKFKIIVRVENGEAKVSFSCKCGIPEGTIHR